MEGITGGLWSLAVGVCPFCKRRDDGTLEMMFCALSSDADMENLSKTPLVLRCMKVPTVGGKTADKAIECTRGGLNTKLHAIVDGLGNPVTFPLSVGNDHDSIHVIELLEKIEINSSSVLADRAGAQTVRAYISKAIFLILGQCHGFRRRFGGAAGGVYFPLLTLYDFWWIFLLTQRGIL